MNNEGLLKCYDIENNEQAFSCVKQIVKESDGEACRPKLVLLTQVGCPHCEKERELRADDLKAGIISEINVLTDEGKEIIRINELDSVPALLLLDCHNKLIE